jgi:uncharacterized protein YwqG
VDAEIEDLLKETERNWNSLHFCTSDERIFFEWVGMTLERERPGHNLALASADSDFELPNCRVVHSDMSAKDFLGAASRQDPDCVVVDQRVSEAVETMTNLKCTGHRMMCQWTQSPQLALEQFLNQLEGGAAFWGQVFNHDYFFEFDSSGQLVRVYQLQGELVLRLRRQDGQWQVLAEAAARQVPPAPTREPISWDADWPKLHLRNLVQAELPLKTTYLPQLGGVPQAGQSRLGGPALLASESDWPLCGDCRHRLKVVLQLNLEELPGGLWPGSGWLQFFYCDHPDCSCPNAWETSAKNRHLGVRQGELQGFGESGAAIVGWQEKLEACRERRWEVLEPWAGSWMDDLEDPEFSHWYPGYLEQLEVTPEQLVEVLPHMQTYDGDKLGGWPHFTQGPEHPLCPDCQQEMPMIFQINNESGHFQQLFAEDGNGHIFGCHQHQRLAFSWACG